MDANTFKDFDAFANLAYEKGHEFLQSAAMKDIRETMDTIAKKYPEISLSFNIHVTAFDENKEDALPLLRFGLTNAEGSKAYEHTADCSPIKYWVQGTPCIVPHDHCPRCWGSWDFKEMNNKCRHCGARLGKEVKFMIDADVCPYCETGTITQKDYTCNGCGFTVNPEWVVWG